MLRELGRTFAPALPMANMLKLAVLMQSASWGSFAPALPMANMCSPLPPRARACVAPSVPFVGAALCPGRLRGGSDAEYSSGAETEAGASPWDENAQHSDPEEDEEMTLAMVGNFSAKLPERSRRLGPLQMSWGLSGTTVDADTEWRNDLRASIRGENSEPVHPARTDVVLGPVRGALTRSAMLAPTGEDPVASDRRRLVRGSGTHEGREDDDNSSDHERHPRPEYIFERFLAGASFWTSAGAAPGSCDSQVGVKETYYRHKRDQLWMLCYPARNI